MLRSKKPSISFDPCTNHRFNFECATWDLRLGLSDKTNKQCEPRGCSELAFVTVNRPPSQSEQTASACFCWHRFKSSVGSKQPHGLYKLRPRPTPFFLALSVSVFTHYLTLFSLSVSLYSLFFLKPYLRFPASLSPTRRLPLCGWSTERGNEGQRQGTKNREKEGERVGMIG